MASKDYSIATKTRGGHDVKDVKWNSVAGKYLGFVKDPTALQTPFLTKMEGWSTCAWTKGGKCVNQTRPELDLVL